MVIESNLQGFHAWKWSFSASIPLARTCHMAASNCRGGWEMQSNRMPRGKMEMLGK